MTENLRESLSALMDGEASELEVRRVLATMDQGDEVRQTWRRYQLASSVMRKSATLSLNIDISERVAQSIADEEIELVSEVSESPAAWRKVWRPVTSVAVAASVAVAVVFGTLQFAQDEQAVPFTAKSNTAPDALLAGAPAANSVKDIMTVSDENLTPAQKRLKALIETHTQQADISRSRSFMPYAQLVSDGESQRY